MKRQPNRQFTDEFICLQGCVTSLQRALEFIRKVNGGDLGLQIQTPSESAYFAIFGNQKRTRKRQQLALLHSSIIQADLESQRCRQVAKKLQEKYNSRFYIR